MARFCFHLLVDPIAVSRQKRLELPVDAVPPVRLPDEIQHREGVLLRRPAQTAPELLQEDGEALQIPFTRVRSGSYLASAARMASSRWSARAWAPV